MQPGKLETAIREAERFLATTRKVEIKTINGIGPMDGKSWPSVVSPTKENAACLRASMELTRALAELRK